MAEEKKTPQSGKQPYEPPQVVFERELEALATACGKTEADFTNDNCNGVLGDPADT
jgi:hypothetical protein